MYRRRALTLILGVAAGCSTQSTDPTSTPPQSATPTEMETETETPPTTEDGAATESSTESESPSRSGIEGAVAALNGVYAELQPAFETLEVAGLDEALLTTRLREAETALAGVTPADSTEEERVQSLSDTHWIFDRLTRALLRVREVYAIHTQLLAAYRASDFTQETATQSGRFQTLANEAASSSGTAVLRYDELDEFDPALDVDYAAFETEIFNVSDTIDGLVPFGLGLRGAIQSRELYLQGEALYDEGSYRDAQNTFLDALSDFTDAREQFQAAEGVIGPLEPHLARYLCETRVARLACTEYRAACREQLDGDTDTAQRRREAAEARYTECETEE